MKLLRVLETVYSASSIFSNQAANPDRDIAAGSSELSFSSLRFEDWETCGLCEFDDIKDTVLNTTWSTVLPAFSRGYIGVNQEQREVVVAYRGTTHIMDVLTDAQLVQSRWPDGAHGSRVHLGFLLAYLASREAVQEALDTLAADPSYNGYSLYFVGHSLGGAQATLAYAEFLQTHYDKLYTGNERRMLPRLVTFGAPRVGNGKFAQYLNMLGGIRSNGAAMVRTVHESDIIPHMPRSTLLYEYVHSDREVWIRGSPGNGTGNDDESTQHELVVCDISDGYGEDGDCSEGVSPLLWNLPDHMWYPGIRIGIPEYLQRRSQ
ncbi:alpha/beta-hydrolase [Martensiomyces pterosporus]|nr:alpha/beta-hydrolase [Martensiomyces pterosporus]